MAETSVINPIDGGPPGGTITKESLIIDSEEDIGENRKLTTQFVLANELLFKRGEKERKNNPIGARIKLLIINIITKHPNARISTMSDVLVKIETMPTDDETAATFFDFDPNQKQRTGRISFGLKIATDDADFWVLKKPLFEFLKTNHIIIHHHNLKTKSVQFSRIGCLIKINPSAVHLPSMETQLNNDIKAKWVKMSINDQKALFPPSTIFDKSPENRIPEVRLLKGRPKVRVNNHTIE